MLIKINHSIKMLLVSSWLFFLLKVIHAFHIIYLNLKSL